MPTPFIMPKFEMTQEYGTVVNWLVEEGNWVEKGAPVLEVETDKVVMEVEAPSTGFLRDVQAQVGDQIPVAQVIAQIYDRDEESTPAPAPDGPAPRSDAPAPERRPKGETPLARRVAEAAGVDINDVSASGPGGRVTRQDVESYLEAAAAAGQPSEKPRATPAARRLASEEGLALEDILGSGPRQRIQAFDVQAVVDQEAQRAAAAPQPAPAPRADPEEVEIIPLQGMRRTIAERLQHSYQTAPHVTFTREVDMSAVNALRAGLNEKIAPLNLPRISVTAILVRVCAWALARHPWVNSSLFGDNIYRYRAANVGVAVALDEGLIAPVIHNAGPLGLAEISRQLQDLSERARRGQLLHQEVSGGTFTISNLGMFGVDEFTAILNPPQSAILAVGRTLKRPVVVEAPDGDRVEIRPTMRLTLSADHRIIDGAIAARFLEEVVAALEKPDLLLL